jgi:hypothetical protein
VRLRRRGPRTACFGVIRVFSGGQRCLKSRAASYEASDRASLTTSAPDAFGKGMVAKESRWRELTLPGLSKPQKSDETGDLLCRALVIVLAVA